MRYMLGYNSLKMDGGHEKNDVIIVGMADVLLSQVHMPWYRRLTEDVRYLLFNDISVWYKDWTYGIDVIELWRILRTWLTYLQAVTTKWSRKVPRGPLSPLYVTFISGIRSLSLVTYFWGITVIRLVPSQVKFFFDGSSITMIVATVNNLDHTTFRSPKRNIWKTKVTVIIPYDCWGCEQTCRE